MRTDSIYKVLERADRAGGTSYVNDLMIFLAETAGDRFALARDLVVDDWGFKTSKTALCEGYNSYLPFWRLERAAAAAKSTAKNPTYTEEQQRLIEQRTFERLAAHDLDDKALLGFARLELERQKIKLADRRVKVIEAKIEKAHAKLQELLNPENDEAARKAILAEVDAIMGVKKPEEKPA